MASQQHRPILGGLCKHAFHVAYARDCSCRRVCIEQTYDEVLLSSENRACQLYTVLLAIDTYASIATGAFLMAIGALFLAALCCAEGPVPRTQLMLSVIALAMGAITFVCLVSALLMNPK
jgi:hypothetical protein